MPNRDDREGKGDVDLEYDDVAACVTSAVGRVLMVGPPWLGLCGRSSKKCIAIVSSLRSLFGDTAAEAMADHGATGPACSGDAVRRGGPGKPTEEGLRLLGLHPEVCASMAVHG